MRLRSASRRQAALAAALLAAVVAWFLGKMSVDNSNRALLDAMLLGCASLAFVRPTLLAVAVVPGVFLTKRAAGGQLSYSDALLIAGCVAPVLTGWRTLASRRLLTLFVVYEVLLVPVVLAHPTNHAVVEWLHRALLLGGGVAVGAYVVRRGATTLALRLFLLVALAVSGAAIFDALTKHFAAAYPFGLQKNFVGNMAVAALLLLLTVPLEIGLPKHFLVPAVVLLLGGLFASQSRGAMVGGVAAMAVLIAVSGSHRRPVVLLLVGVPVAIVMVVSIRSQASYEARVPASRAYFLPFEIRRRVGDQALKVWRASPIVGQGLRVYTAGREDLPVSPHNVVLEALAESGVLGLGAFALLQVGVVVVLMQDRAPLGRAAVAVVVAALVHGTLDLYWIAGRQTFTWLVVGMAVGARVGVERALVSRTA